jgi:hypothetical protein
VASIDIAFGWQSIIQFSAEAIFHCIRVLALPCSWCVSSALAYPARLKIEGIRDHPEGWPFLSYHSQPDLRVALSLPCPAHRWPAAAHLFSSTGHIQKKVDFCKT